MLDRSSHLHSFLAVVLSAVSVWAAMGYLPTVGPAPLRFETPPEMKPASRPLPPLELPEAVPTAAATEPEFAPTLTQDKQVAALPPSAPPGPPPTATNLVQAAPTDATTEMVTPQMFIKFFTNAASNAPANAIFLPVGFRPAQPGTGPSSSATYTVGP